VLYVKHDNISQIYNSEINTHTHTHVNNISTVGPKSQPLIVQVLLVRKMIEVCNFHHRYNSTTRDKMRRKKNPGNHIVGFLKNVFVNYGGK